MRLSALYADRLTTRSAATDPADAADDAAPRLRLLHCRLERGPSATSRVSVALAGADGARPIECREEGPACAGGDLRLAARATLSALAQATGGVCTFDLIGVKAIRAFDATVLMVAAFATRDGASMRIVGAAIADGDLLAATAQAACHAANRFVMPRTDVASVIG